MKRINFGPFFSACESQRVCQHVQSLGIQMEWADENRAVRLPLYWHGRESIKFDRVLYERRSNPFEIECSSFQVVESGDRTFLPLQALLVALYDNHHANRRIFAVLEEFASLTPLQCRVSRPIATVGRLIKKAETAGFFLNTVIREGFHIYAHIVWRSPVARARFHSCIAKFEIQNQGSLDEGVWVPPGAIGVDSLLARELHRIAPGRPGEIFTKSGLDLITPTIGEISPNKKAYENPVSTGVSGTL